MKLSGMQDGPMKSVTVPEIPGQLGPMVCVCEPEREREREREKISRFFMYCAIFISDEVVN